MSGDKGGRGLSSVLLLKVGLPVFILLTVFLSASLQYVTWVIEEQLQRELRQVARAIRLPVTQALNSGNYEQLNYSLKSVLDISEVYGVYLFDNQGKRLVTLGSVRPTQEQATKAVEQVEGQEFDQFEDIRGRHVYSFFLPIFNETAEPSGLLQVTRRYSDIQASLFDFKLYSWLSLIAFSLLLLWLLLVTHRRAIGQHLSHLLDSMNRISLGESDHRAKSYGPKEVRDLAHGMNTMLDAIQEAEARAQREIESKKIMGEQLRRSETLAALGQLSAGVAHELGAPLNVVDARAQRIQRRLATSDSNQKELVDIRHQVERMCRIIEQLLTYGRSSRIERQHLDVADLIARCVQQVEQDGVTSIISGPPATIYSDYLSIEQCIINVLRNGWQANPSGPVSIGWYLNTEHECVIYIEDQGPGIPESQRENVFEPFVTSKLPGEGTGLGLAIVQRIMHENKGRINITDGTQQGARIELVFPAAVGE